MKNYPKEFAEYNLGNFRLKYCTKVYYMLLNLIPIYLFDIHDNDYKVAINKFNNIANGNY